MCIGFADSYSSFLLFRLFIGIIGAAFVITQYHTSLMFAPNVVGVANATTAGWGNLGGGVTNLVMPIVFTLFIGFGFGEPSSWRYAMLVAGASCLLMGIAYFFLTQDTPEGNFKELRASGKMESKKVKGAFLEAAKDPRSWLLFAIYGACFGIELTVNNVAAMYFGSPELGGFDLDLKTAGIVAGLFGLMNIFARSLGGYVGDRFGILWGLKGRARWLFLALFIESIALLVFSRMDSLVPAIASLVVFSLFVQMSEGATYSVVPFVNKKALGAVSGIVGAGGNMGAVCAGFLFKGELPWNDAFMVLGFCVMGISFLALLVRFSAATENETRLEINESLAKKAALKSSIT
jgi:NNP family nitrate/nitrite transporter-like MFS transporter